MLFIYIYIYRFPLAHLPFSRPGLPLYLSFDQADVLRDSGISRLRVALSDAMAWNERSYGTSPFLTGKSTTLW